VNTQEPRHDLFGSPPTSEQERLRRSELREFLRSARERINPAVYNIEVDRRRRATGLRREEVAHLAGVSTGWYTLLETARNRRVSTRMLDRVARVLMLSDVEKLRLYTLAFPEIPSLAESFEPRESGGLGALRVFVAHLRGEQSADSIGYHIVDFLSQYSSGAADCAFFVRSGGDAKQKWVELSRSAEGFPGLAIVEYEQSSTDADKAIFLYGIGRDDAVPEADIERTFLACEIAACRVGLQSVAALVSLTSSSGEELCAHALRFVTVDASAQTSTRPAGVARTTIIAEEVGPLLRS
jgi:transcriptional regulator with XRE-family HTH domain